MIHFRIHCIRFDMYLYYVKFVYGLLFTFFFDIKSENKTIKGRHSMLDAI